MEDSAELEDIVIEFEGNFDFDSVKDKQIDVIGIDTDEPVLKIESKFYKLSLQNSIGSRLLLKPNAEGKLQYFAKTDKIVTARRVMLKDRRD